MKIESIIKRRNGHSVELDGKTYDFLPPDYIAEVTDRAHIGRLLSIAEGYQSAEGEKVERAPEPPKKQEHEHVELLGSELHPSAFEIGGKQYPLNDVVEKAFAASGLDASGWNALSEGERADRIDAVLDELSGEGSDEAGGEGEKSEEEVLAELADQYKEKFGKKPHHKWNAERIRKELEGE